MPVCVSYWCWFSQHIWCCISCWLGWETDLPTSNAPSSREKLGHLSLVLKGWRFGDRSVPGGWWRHQGGDWGAWCNQKRPPGGDGFEVSLRWQVVLAEDQDVSG
jgi:hypothetical protein